MSNQIRLAEFQEVWIGVAGTGWTEADSPVDGTDYQKYSGFFEDGREITLGEAMNIVIDNGQEIPISQEAVITIPFVDGSSMVTQQGSGVTPETGKEAATTHVIIHNSTLPANKAKIRLVGVSGSKSIEIDNAIISLVPAVVQANGENVFADILNVKVKGQFGTVATII